MHPLYSIISIMKKYELLVTLPGTLDDKEAEQHIQDILAMVKANGQEAELNNLGKIRLSYPIKQIRYGYYYTIVFQAEAAGIRAIEDKLRLRTDVLRGMITYFNTNLTAAKKIVYSTNEVGVTTMREAGTAGTAEEGGTSDKKVDLKEINEKLNEILDAV